MSRTLRMACWRGVTDCCGARRSPRPGWKTTRPVPRFSPSCSGRTCRRSGGSPSRLCASCGRSRAHADLYDLHANTRAW